MVGGHYGFDMGGLKRFIPPLAAEFLCNIC